MPRALGWYITRWARQCISGLVGKHHSTATTCARSSTTSITRAPLNQAAMLAAVQRPAALNQYGEPSGPPAWETIPSWSLIGTADRVITPAQQRAMSTNAGAQISTVNTGHLSLVIRPNAVTNIIETAVDATT